MRRAMRCRIWTKKRDLRLPCDFMTYRNAKFSSFMTEGHEINILIIKASRSSKSEKLTFQPQAESSM